MTVVAERRSTSTAGIEQMRKVLKPKICVIRRMEKEGGIAAAVVGVGGFLGIGEKNVAVPFEKITVADQPDSDEIKLTTTETAESLKAAPEFKTKSQVMAERNADQPVDTSTTSATGTTPAPAQPAEPAPQQ